MLINVVVFFQLLNPHDTNGDKFEEHEEAPGMFFFLPKHIQYAQKALSFVILYLNHGLCCIQDDLNFLPAVTGHSKLWSKTDFDFSKDNLSPSESFLEM